jgi:hypothetical protein
MKEPRKNFCVVKEDLKVRYTLAKILQYFDLIIFNAMSVSPFNLFA